jgi:hypothetical protein
VYRWLSNLYVYQGTTDAAVGAASDANGEDAGGARNGHERREGAGGGGGGEAAHQDALCEDAVFQGNADLAWGQGGCGGGGGVRGGGVGSSAGRELVIDTWGVDDVEERSIEDKIEELGVRGMDGMVAAVDSMASLVKGSSLNLGANLPGALSSIGGAVGRGKAGRGAGAGGAPAGGAVVSWPSPLGSQGAECAPATTLATASPTPTAAGVADGAGAAGVSAAEPLVVKPAKGKSKASKSAKKAVAPAPPDASEDAELGSELAPPAPNSGAQQRACCLQCGRSDSGGFGDSVEAAARRGAEADELRAEVAQVKSELVDAKGQLAAAAAREKQLLATNQRLQEEVCFQPEVLGWWVVWVCVLGSGSREGLGCGVNGGLWVEGAAAQHSSLSMFDEYTACVCARVRA